MASIASHVIVFWDGKSKGTKHMIDVANQKNLNVTIVKFQKHEMKIKYRKQQEGEYFFFINFNLYGYVFLDKKKWIVKVDFDEVTSGKSRKEAIENYIEMLERPIEEFRRNNESYLIISKVATVKSVISYNVETVYCNKEIKKTNYPSLSIALKKEVNRAKHHKMDRNKIHCVFVNLKNLKRITH